MKRIFIIMLIFLCSFIITALFSMHKAKAAYLFDTHIIAGGMSGSDGIPIKVDSAGKIYLH